LIASLLWPTLAVPGSAPVVGAAPGAQQAEAEAPALATLEVRQGEVQWSPAGASDWEAVADRQPLRDGDRVRTEAGASARLLYYERAVTELGPETGVLVQRIERTAARTLVAALYQAGA
jgi:hypothetical protein